MEDLLNQVIIDGISDAYDTRGTIFDVDPMATDLAPDDEVLTSFAGKLADNEFGMMFGGIRKQVKNLMKQTLYNIIEDDSITLEEIEIPDEDVDVVFQSLIEEGF